MSYHLKPMKPSLIIEVPERFTPRDHQLTFLRQIEGSDVKRTILLWHRRAGKDLISWVYLIRQAVKKVGIYYYLFPTTELAKKVFWQGMADGGRKVIDLLPKQLIKKINRIDHTIELSNGSLIYVIGGFDPDSLRGVVAHGLILSEYAWHEPAIWSEVFSPVLSASGGWALFNSTPDGPNHYYELYRNVLGNPAWLISEVRNSQTGIVSATEIKAMLDSGEITEDKMQQEYECQFTTRASGSFFGDLLQRAKQEGRIGHYDYNPSKPVDTYWDLGGRDDTTVWFVQRDGARFNIIDYYEDAGKPLKAYYDMLLDRGYMYRFHFLPHDGVRRNMGINEYLTTQQMFDKLLQDDPTKHMGKSVICAKPHRKIHAINGIRGMFHSLYFNEPTVGKGIKRLSLYKRKYSPQLKTYASEPAHDENSHAADAFMNIFLGLNQEASEMLDFSSYPPVPACKPYDLF